MRPSIAPLGLFAWKPAFHALAPVANRRRPYGTKTTSSNNFQAARKKYSHTAGPNSSPSHNPGKRKIPWPHAPTHMLAASGTYFVSAGTYLKQHHFRARQRLSVLHRGLLTVARDFGWSFEAWAVFSNHYHFVGHSPAGQDSAASLSQMLRLLHRRTARWINDLNSSPRRKVWHNYRETRLTYEKSYLARLNYVHQNPVKHGLVLVASQYPWCSAGWFEQTATPAQVKTIYNFPVDRLNVDDDFDVEAEM